MKKVVVTSCFICIIFLLCSCKTYEVLKVKEEYSNQPLYMDEIFVVNCKRGDCNTNLTDSLTLIMKEAFSDLNLNINYNNPLNNVYNDTVWRDTIPPKYFAQRKLNEDYMMQFPFSNNELKLVPFIYYHEVGGFSISLDTYEISIVFVIFVIDDDNTIYHSRSWIANTTHYVKNLDDFNKEDINTALFIKPVIYKALNPYIERSGNGKKIETD